LGVGVPTEPRCDPVLIVGAGLSAADAVLAARFRSLPIIHVFRKKAGTLGQELPENMYPEYHKVGAVRLSSAVFLNCRAAASVIPGRERPEETTICYKISLVQLITNLNAFLYLSACHTVYISVLILFMIIP
jgi:hypothetical protein